MKQIDTKKIAYFLMVVLFIVIPKTCFLQSSSHPAKDDEFVGPFSSWIDVKKEFGLKGNGNRDETAKIQAALDLIGNSTSTASVLYLPAGTYRISKTLRINNKINISLIGENPATTKIIWGGVSGGTMLQIDGTAYSRFNRISYDGGGKASIAIDQSWKGTAPNFDTGNEYADNVFSDVDFGIVGGNSGLGFAEIAIWRCKFFRNKKAGVSLGNFNALDVWVWNSVFEDCNIGVTNGYGAGNFKVYNSVFRRSTSTDIYIGHTGEFSFRDNFSSNSQQFLVAGFTANAALMIVQGNTVVDPVKDEAVYIGNHGPVTFIDNIIRSRATATAPIVLLNTSPGGSFLSMGNTFTVENALEVGTTKIVYDKQVVSAGSLSSLAEPSLPGTQPNLTRRIFDVPLGSNAAAIQNIINQAASQTGTRPVVHFAWGTYNISTTLTIPAGSDMQIVGDGLGDRSPTWLKWTGAPDLPVINVVGPSKATLRDFAIDGNHAAHGVVMTGVDQAGSRIFMDQITAPGNQTNLLVNSLDYTRVMCYNSVFRDGAKSINVIGGPRASSGSPAEGRTILYGCGQSNNVISHEVTNGGNLLVRDVWYEGNSVAKYLNMSGLGTCTVEGSHIFSPESATVPLTAIANLSGKATFISSSLTGPIEVSGDGSRSKILGLSVLSAKQTYIVNNSSPSASINSFNTRYVDPNAATSGTGSLPAANIGTPDEASLISMLEQARSAHAQVLTPLANGVTDVRMYRLWVTKAVKGIELRASGSSQLNQASAMSNNSVYNNNVMEVLAPDLQVKAKQNPTRNFFTLQTSSNNHEPLKITVTDLLGRKLETKAGISPNGYFSLGDKYPAGVYLAEVIQGEKKVAIRLLKQ